MPAVALLPFVQKEAIKSFLGNLLGYLGIDRIINRGVEKVVIVYPDTGNPQEISSLTHVALYTFLEFILEIKNNLDQEDKKGSYADDYFNLQARLRSPDFQGQINLLASTSGENSWLMGLLDNIACVIAFFDDQFTYKQDFPLVRHSEYNNQEKIRSLPYNHFLNYLSIDWKNLPSAPPKPTTVPWYKRFCQGKSLDEWRGIFEDHCDHKDPYGRYNAIIKLLQIYAGSDCCFGIWGQFRWGTHHAPLVQSVLKAPGHEATLETLRDQLQKAINQQKAIVKPDGDLAMIMKLINEKITEAPTQPNLIDRAVQLLGFGLGQLGSLR